MLLQILLFVDTQVPLGVLNVRVPEQRPRRFDVLALIIKVGGLGFSEVVALDCLAVLLEEAREPPTQGVAGSNSSLRGEYYSVVQRILLRPVGLHRLNLFWVNYHGTRSGLLRLEFEHDEAVAVRDSLRDLVVRHAYHVLDTAGAPV